MHLVIDGLVAGTPSARLVESLLADGVTAVNWTVGNARDSLESAMGKMTQLFWLKEYLPGKLLIVESVADIERARRECKLGVVMGFQGAEFLARSIHLLTPLQRLGLRVLQLTYNERGAFGSGCLETHDGGLPHVGGQLIREANHLGVLIDLSHAGERTSLQAMDVSTRPVIFSHANARGRWDNPRNLTDAQIRACAGMGGVIGIAAFSAFVGETAGGRRPGISELIDHVEYVAEMVGPEHVALGLDMFDDASGGAWWTANTLRRYPEQCGGMSYHTHEVEGISRETAFTRTAEGLQDRGFTQEQVRMVLGGNWLRVFASAWATQGGEGAEGSAVRTARPWSPS